MALVLTVTGAFVGAAATDGTFQYHWANWADAKNWSHGVMPSADGTAILLPLVKKAFIEEAAGVNRIELPGCGTDAADSIDLSGAGSLAFSGTDGGIELENTKVFPKVVQNSVVLSCAPTIGIPSGVVAAFGGGGTFTFNDVSGAGTIKVTDGELAVTNASPSFSGTVDLRGGSFAYSPSVAGSLTLASLARNHSGMLFACGTADNPATVTVGTLGTRQNRAVLGIGVGDGRTLGTDDKVIVTDATTVPVHDGVVDPVFFGRKTKFSYKDWDDMRADFLTYDATDGFKLFTPTKSLAEATATDIALVNGAVSATTKSVKGVAIEYARKDQITFLTVPSDVTLTVGDGVNPAAILVNAGTGYSGSQTAKIEGDGTIAFGGSEGIVAFATGHPYSSLSIFPTITGSNGVTFMNAIHKPSNIYLDRPAGWTGPTHVWSERLRIVAGDRLPAGGDVYVNGEKGYNSACLWLDGTMTLDQHFHLRGHGGQHLLPYGVLWAGNKTVTVTFTGSVELTGDADFNASYQIGVQTPMATPSTLAFQCPLTGTGLLTLAGGRHNFLSGSSVSGIDGLYLRGNGELKGDGADFSQAGFLKTDAGTKSVFRLMDGTRFARGVDADGAVTFVTGTHTLVGDSAIGTLALEGAATLVVDGHLTAGVAETAMMDGNATVRAASGKTSVFEVNATNDQALAIHVEDGEGTLDFVKSGAGTLKLGGTLAYTGKTVVREGTLTFAKSIMDDPGISWWFDATNASAMTKNDDGKVMSVASKVGTQRLVNWDGAYTGPKVVNKLNGLDVFTYTHDDHDGFRTENETCQRTVFLVDMPRNHYAIMGLYGDYGDRGVRADNSTDTYRFYHNPSGYVTQLSCNGSPYDWYISYELGKAQIVALSRDKADDYAAGNIYSHYQAYIGLYCPYDSRGFDGDIAEMIAFNRKLSDEECLQVEKYLADRWGLTLSREPAGTATLARPQAASALEIADGATVDLAGRDLTVASLSGAGAIVNTGATPAKLTVTGACTFRGTVGAGVTLKASGKLDVAVAAGGGLDLATGTTSLGRNYDTPMTDALALWLDASRAETVTTNANGAVTQWRSLAGRMTGVVSGLGWGERNTGPRYGADSDGKPACCFDLLSNLACANMSPRTVIVAAKLRAQPSFAVTSWGLHNADSEWRTDDKATFVRCGIESVDELAVEHADGSSSRTMSADDRFISVWRVQDGRFPNYATDSHWIDGADGVNCKGIALGANWNGSVEQDINEVLVYERCLTDAELEPIRDYLRDKWIRSAGATVGRQPAPVLAEGATLGLSGGTTDLSALGPVSLATLASDGTGGSLTGDVTVTGSFTFDAGGATTVSPLVVNGSLTLGAGAVARVLGQHNLEHHVEIPALRTSGAWTGEFASESFEAPARRWRTYRANGEWGITYGGGMMLILR